ncbi:MarR family transcriptional regulator [Micromonospora acroterricola]|uniref:MarR family transcriptional regulator n=1 Tax=Micromonospora acroterricola TaxID=2202421 RepID=A0A317DHN9_9ACTN|nr:MarR family winged helix-turn-helix transcriptional regulator [Micromonospora acroterricola]PWR12323.1 MarR family transcriptional regulator [Micromonospora acroterricola]
MNSEVRELGLRLYDLVRSVRLLKQRRADERPSVPPGLVGLLVQIDQLSSGCHARELADRTRLDPSTVSRSVATLVAQGLVERRPDPTDKRATFLTVTPAGRAALTDSHGWYGDVLERALATWTPGEVRALNAALDRFTGDIEVALGNHDNLEAAR